MNKLYVEFYYKEKESMILNNSFSSCHNLCDNMIAVEIKPDSPEYTINQLRNILSHGEYDTVYVTVIFSWYVYFIYMVAKEFPNINFITGGSGAIWLKKIHPPENIPVLPNFELSSESLEYIFPNFFKEKQWGLNLPSIDGDVKNIS